MLFQAILTPEAFVFFLIAVIYVLGKRYMEKSIQRNQLRSIEEQVAKIAATDQCSVYDLFHKAGAIWNFSKPKIEADFKAYLKRGELPPYITDYARKRETNGQSDSPSPFDHGGDLPGSWAA